MKKYHSSLLQSGQVLLLITLFITSLLTVVMSLSFRAARDTQVTLARTEVNDLGFAAETAAEQAIALHAEDPESYSSGTIAYADLFSPEIKESVEFGSVNFDSSSVQIRKEFISDEFISPGLKKDQQYVLYLSEYKPFQDGSLEFENAYDDTLKMAIRTMDDDNGRKCGKVAVEVTIVHGFEGAYKIARFVLDKDQLVSATGDTRNFTPSRISVDNTYECVVTLEGGDFETIEEKRLLIARVFYEDEDINEVHLIFRPLNSSLFPPQGVSFISEAVSDLALKKRVKVFQSYPQVPADLFVTRF